MGTRKSDEPTADYCPKNEDSHTFSDWSHWNDENHPTCDHCGYVDRSRLLRKECKNCEAE